jgi:seryl-tRNA synthetase
MNVPMIDLKDLRERPAAYQAACDKKRISFSIEQFLALDAKVRDARSSFETVRAEQNSVNKEIAALKGEQKTERLSQIKQLATAVKEREQALKELETDWLQQQLLIPSIPMDRVPVGKDDTQNVQLRTWGEPRNFSFSPKDHAEIGKLCDILDIERGVKIAGARNYFLKGDGTRLQHAVLQFALDKLHAKGYCVMDVPHLVSYKAMMGTSYFPGGEDAAYQLDPRDPDSFLIGTAEVSVTSYHADEIFALADLPKRYAGYSPCYRREAGTYGKDTQGVYRVHQFYKVEQVIVCLASADESARFHAEILGNAEELLQELELAYRVVDVCTGDMGRGQVYKNDLETWMPSRQGYGETHSCSTFYDFQARRLNMRYKDASGKNLFCHTLNNTCAASPRLLIPLLETHQQEDGSVRIPKVLQRYMNGQEVISVKRR